MSPRPVVYETTALPLSYAGLDGGRLPQLSAADRRRLRALTTPADLRRIKRLARQLVAGAITEAEAEARAVAK